MGKRGLSSPRKHGDNHTKPGAAELWDVEQAPFARLAMIQAVTVVQSLQVWHDDSHLPSAMTNAIFSKLSVKYGLYITVDSSLSTIASQAVPS
jgi:hypothetical protein